MIRGVTYRRGDEVESGGHKILRANNIDKDSHVLDLSDIKLVSKELNLPRHKKLRKYDIFICLASGSKKHIGKVAFIQSDTSYYFGGFMGAVRSDSSLVSPAYLFYQLRGRNFNQFLRDRIAGANINNLGSRLFYQFSIPLPPLNVQQEIVDEIESYQKVIDGARAVIDNYRPHIPIDPDWPTMDLHEVFELSSGRALTRVKMKPGPFPDYGGNGKSGTHSSYFISEPTIVIARVGAYCGAVHITDSKFMGD